MNAAFPRNSILNERHIALGTKFESSWNGMPLPQFYATDPYDEVATVRSRAGLIDVSSLNLVNVTGPDAVALLDAVLTSDIGKMKPGQSAISNIVDDGGSLIDDVLVYRNGTDDFRLSHGSGKLEDVLAAFAGGRDVSVANDGDTHVLSLQGPLALDILTPHASIDLSTLKYFEHAPAELFGRKVTLARGGYSAERGYEVFSTAADTVFLWDAILEAGKPFGAMPVSWQSLDIVRVEGALLFFPYDMPKGDETPWEVGADWTVDLDKPAFRGKEALIRRKSEARVVQRGMEIDHHEQIEPGARLIKDGVDVGSLNSSIYSRHLMRSIALVHVRPDLGAFGTEFEVVGPQGTFTGRLVKTPFYDPLRLRTHPLEERG
ncbi:aminomethyltransferase family protein [Ancylobacter sp. Lp-2]|uniref:aminomethyltransferase family protein n=1 Tax=Ancylobacter sp. Lp-2 TaxID=2881339 RepID=UPI001E3630EB|nr:aminomethyltransferase family protein [Ancylobacter sp. Lp-2]MCB4771351.1 aminomethyltransferase family protein [Ancylobacter sp. Lp-2]